MSQVLQHEIPLSFPPPPLITHNLGSLMQSVATISHTPNLLTSNSSLGGSPQELTSFEGIAAASSHQPFVHPSETGGGDVGVAERLSAVISASYPTTSDRQVSNFLEGDSSAGTPGWASSSAPLSLHMRSTNRPPAALEGQDSPSALGPQTAAIATYTIHPVLGVPIPTAAAARRPGDVDEVQRIDDLLAGYYAGAMVLSPPPSYRPTVLPHEDVSPKRVKEEGAFPVSGLGSAKQGVASASEDETADAKDILKRFDDNNSGNDDDDMHLNLEYPMDHQRDARSPILVEAEMDGVFEAEMQLRAERHRQRMEGALHSGGSANKGEEVAPSSTGRNQRDDPPKKHLDRRRPPSPTSTIAADDRRRDQLQTLKKQVSSQLGRIGSLTPAELLTVLVNTSAAAAGVGVCSNAGKYHIEDLVEPTVSEADMVALEGFAAMKEMSFIHREEKERLRGQLNAAVLGGDIGAPPTSGTLPDLEHHHHRSTPGDVIPLGEVGRMSFHSAKQLALKDRAISALYTTVAALREEAGKLQKEYEEYALTVQTTLSDVALRKLDLQLVKQKQDAKYDVYTHGQRRFVDEIAYGWCQEDMANAISRLEATFGGHHLALLEDLGATSAARIRAENESLVLAAKTKLLELLHEDSIQRIQRMEGRLVRKLYSGLYQDILSLFLVGGARGSPASANTAAPSTSPLSGGEEVGDGPVLHREAPRSDGKALPPIMRRVVEAECSDRLNRVASEVSDRVLPEAKHAIEQRLRISGQAGMQRLMMKLDTVLQSPSTHIQSTFRRELRNAVEKAKGDAQLIMDGCDADRRRRHMLLRSSIDVMCRNFDGMVAGSRHIEKGGAAGGGDAGSLSLGSAATATGQPEDDDDATILSRLTAEVSARQRRLVQRRRAARECLKASLGPFESLRLPGYRQRWVEDELGTDSEYEEYQQSVRRDREALHHIEAAETISRVALEASEASRSLRLAEAGSSGNFYLLHDEYDDDGDRVEVRSPFDGRGGRTGTDLFNNQTLLHHSGRLARVRKAALLRGLRRRRALRKRAAKRAFIRLTERRRQKKLQQQRQSMEGDAAVVDEDGSDENGCGGNNTRGGPLRFATNRGRIGSMFNARSPTIDLDGSDDGARRRASSSLGAGAPNLVTSSSARSPFLSTTLQLGRPNHPCVVSTDALPVHREHDRASAPDRRAMNQFPPGVLGTKEEETVIHRLAQINAMRSELEQLRREERDRHHRASMRNALLTRAIAEDDDDDDANGYSRRELQALQELRRLRPVASAAVSHGVVAAGSGHDFDSPLSANLRGMHHYQLPLRDASNSPSLDSPSQSLSAAVRRQPYLSGFGHHTHVHLSPKNAPPEPRRNPPPRALRMGSGISVPATRAKGVVPVNATPTSAVPSLPVDATAPTALDGSIRMGRGRHTRGPPSVAYPHRTPSQRELALRESAKHATANAAPRWR